MCSKTITGLSSRIAAFVRPFASAGFDAATSFRPGSPRNQLDGVCEWQAPKPGAGADSGADDERNARLLVREVPVLRRLVDERVDDETEEVAEHDLDDGAQALDRGAERGARERELGDRRVDDPVVAEALDETRRDVEDSTGLDVLADQDDARVALHLLGEAVADRVAEADLAP